MVRTIAASMFATEIATASTNTTRSSKNPRRRCPDYLGGTDLGIVGRLYTYRAPTDATKHAAFRCKLQVQIAREQESWISRVLIANSIDTVSRVKPRTS